jgi:hypothetical protein
LTATHNFVSNERKPFTEAGPQLIHLQHCVSEYALDHAWSGKGILLIVGISNVFADQSDCVDEAVE